MCRALKMSRRMMIHFIRTLNSYHVANGTLLEQMQATK